MSWSICFIGKPEKVAEALEKESEKMTGESKVEYDSALPHFTALVKENFGNDLQLLKITASGHGYKNNNEPVNRQCQVNIESVYGTLV